jgi:hypothetical protein
VDVKDLSPVPVVAIIIDINGYNFAVMNSVTKNKN